MGSRLLTTPDRATIRRIGIVLLVLVLVAGAGCSALDGDGGGNDTETDDGMPADDSMPSDDGAEPGDDGTSPGDGTDPGTDPGSVSLLDHVPADQDVVMSVDAGVAQDDATRQLFQSGQEEEFDDADLQAGLAAIQLQTGLDPTAIDEVMIFGQTQEFQTDLGQVSNDDARAGILANTGWASADVKNAFDSTGEASLTEVSYSESGVFYRIEDAESLQDDGLAGEQDTYLGFLGNGAYVLGDETSVRGSLDVAYGGADTLGDPLRSAYENTRDGWASVAVLIPEDPDLQGQPGAGTVQDVDAMTAVYYTSGQTVGVEGRLITPDSQTASELSQALQFIMLSIQEDPEFSQIASSLQIDQDGSDVTVTFEEDVQTLLDLSDE